MTSGWTNKLTELLGEHLASCHLIRQGLLVSFTPKNTPIADLFVTNESLKTIPIQLKTIRTGTCQMDAKDFLEIAFPEPRGSSGSVRQRIRRRLTLSNPDLPYIFVWLGKASEDEFYICLARHVQQIIHRKYSTWLRKCKGVRPKNPRSTHCGLTKNDLVKYHDKWNMILNHRIFS